MKRGGHAIVWASKSQAMIVLQDPDQDDPDDLGVWALLDMELKRWSVESRGLLKGLATCNIPRDCLDLVRDRVERDSVHPGTTRVMHLDCEECAACCRKNHVILEKKDITRFQAAGRKDLLRPPFTRRAGNKLVLRLLRAGDCRHLQTDRRCGIYELRPEACRSFPPGSEGCLFSREEEFGVDGAAARGASPALRLG